MRKDPGSIQSTGYQPPHPLAPLAGEALGVNGLISIPGYGSYGLRVNTISYGVQIQSNEEESAQSKVFYPLNTLSSDFSMAVVFLSYDQRNAFVTWIRTYMTLVASDSSVSGYMNVSVPLRNFYRKCVLQGRLLYGQAPTDVTFPMTLTFVGAANPISPSLMSRYVPPSGKQNADEAAFSYPSTDGQAKGYTTFNEILTPAEIYEAWTHSITSGLSYISYEDYYQQVTGHPQ